MANETTSKVAAIVVRDLLSYPTEAPVVININGSVGSDDGPKILRQINDIGKGTVAEEFKRRGAGNRTWYWDPEDVDLL